MNPLSSLKRALGLGDDADQSDATADSNRPRELATAFVDAHPERDLDYTPASLHELDAIAERVVAEREQALAASEDDEANGRDAATDEVSGRDAASDAPELDALDETVRRMGAYLGETFVRSYDAEWRFDESAGWVVRLPATHQGQPIDLTVPSVLGDVIEGDSSFALVHDVFASELDADAPTLAPEDPDDDAVDPRDEPAPAEVVAAFDRLAAELAAEHDALDFTPDSLRALDAVAREGTDRDSDAVAFDPERDDLDLSVRGHTDAIAGYFAGVLRTTHTAEYRGELAETLVVDGATRQATLEPRAIAAAAAADETSFEALYENLREDLGLGAN